MCGSVPVSFKARSGITNSSRPASPIVLGASGTSSPSTSRTIRGRFGGFGAAPAPAGATRDGPNAVLELVPAAAAPEAVEILIRNTPSQRSARAAVVCAGSLHEPDLRPVLVAV